MGSGASALKEQYKSKGDLTKAFGELSADELKMIQAAAGAAAPAPAAPGGGTKGDKGKTPAVADSDFDAKVSDKVTMPCKKIPCKSHRRHAEPPKQPATQPASQPSQQSGATQPLSLQSRAFDCHESTELPDVHSSRQTHDVQLWKQYDISGVVAARLQASWRDQGWGNRKGAIHARVVTSAGEVLYPWRRIGPYPAPHGREHVEIEIPGEFFSGEVPLIRLAVQEHSGQALKIPGDQPAGLVATAVYGRGDRVKDVKEIVQRELAAGRPVHATNDLFGDPCHGKGKTLTVTLTEAAAQFPATGDAPDGASFELGYEVGGGGGHEMHIEEATLRIERVTLLLTAVAVHDQIEITNVAGEVIAAIGARAGGAGSPETAVVEDIQAAVRSALGPGQHARVLLPDGCRVVLV